MDRYKHLFLLSLCALIWCKATGQDDWQIQDVFDEIRGKVDDTTEFNCDSANLDDLFLPEDTVSHHPDVKEKSFNYLFGSELHILHNIGINRAFFWSFILQSRFIRSEVDEINDPDVMYYFLSSVADSTISPNVRASAIYFFPNMAYTSNPIDLLNKTLHRFAPRAFRSPEEVSSRTQYSVKDLGVFNFERSYEDYTSDDYQINEWYHLWLPDDVDKRNSTLAEYQVEIRYANNITKPFTFYGPPGNDEKPGPIKWSRPYFDCGRVNKWLVAAVSPVADIYPRHTQSKDLERPTYAAAVVMEMDFDKIDINQCPSSQGNDGPNRFASTARCKVNTTECVPLHGWGFQRGGYQCRCRSGFHLPSTVGQPYSGEAIERVDLDQYDTNFDCLRTEQVQKLPKLGQRALPSTRAIYKEQFSEYVNLTKGVSALNADRINIHEVLNFIKGVQRRNCHKYHWSDLIINKDFAYGAEEQFENQAKMAVRLANFISAFLQVPGYINDINGNTITAKPLTEDQMFAETLSIMFGDSKIWSAGILWDRYKYPNRTFFAPFAYKTNFNDAKLKMEDLARFDNLEAMYTHKPWFEFLKQRWSTTYDSLARYLLKLNLHGNETDGTLKQFHKNTNYRAATMEQGYWSKPYFDCDGYHKQWMMTYASPFFGWDSANTKLEFKGVVAVSMSLMSLDINQCNSDSHVPNAFKNTDKCDKQTSYCVPLRGRGFTVGGYKCECRQGYEYPFEGPATYFDGQLVEAELLNIIANKGTRIDMLKCRTIGASSNQTQI